MQWYGSRVCEEILWLFKLADSYQTLLARQSLSHAPKEDGIFCLANACIAIVIISLCLHPRFHVFLVWPRRGTQYRWDRILLTLFRLVFIGT